MLIPNKREALARALRAAGVLRLIERRARRPGLLVLAYHRIGDAAGDPFYDPIVSASAEGFRAQVAHLRDRFRVVMLEEAAAIAAGEARPEGPAALVTFDDGYRDNLDVALPILRELGVPAAFFLPTGFLDRPRLPWWDRVAFAVKRSGRDRLALDVPEPLEVALPPGDRRGAMRAVIAAFLRAARPDDPTALGHLEERAGVAVDAEGLGRSLLLGWDGARALAAAGMDVGSHTHDHRNLARLPEAEQAEELSRSRARLEAELGRPILTLAYPFGGPDAVSAATRRLAREAGYRAAFTLEPGLNRPGAIDPLAVRRLNIGPTDTAALFRARTALTATFGASPL